MTRSILSIVGSGWVCLSSSAENLSRSEAAKLGRVIDPIRSAEDMVRAAMLGLPE